MAKRKRSAGDLNTSARLYLVHDPDQNARIVDAARQQRTVHNVTVAHLLRHRSDEPLQKNTAKGVTGLYGHWTEWRGARSDLAEIPCKVARGAMAAAADQVAKWEDTNLEHAIAVARATDKDDPIPRAVQKRQIDTRKLYRSRKDEERRGRHRVRIDQGVTRKGPRTLYVPGIGEVRTKEVIPCELDVRACVILERTPRPRVRRGVASSERTFRIQVNGRLPAPKLKAETEVGKAVGIDHGTVTPMTAVDTNDIVTTFEHDIEQAVKAKRRVRRTQKRLSNCRRRSRKWKRRKKLVAAIRGKLCRRRRHTRQTWARQLCERYDTVCIEKLEVGNMTRSSRGTAEEHGQKVRQKAGLNRGLLGIAPAEQTALLKRAGEKRGTRIELVPAWGTSITCNACGHTDRKNRESQAVFRCKACGHEDNADANAARNMRDRGSAAIRARVNASREESHLPKGADASAWTGRQEESRRHEKRTPPERAPERGIRGFDTPSEAQPTQESWQKAKTQESWPNGQYS